MNILVTAIGTAAATAIVTQLNKLKKEEHIHIVGADIYHEYEVGTAKFVDEFYQFPSVVADLDKYYNFLIKFCREHKIHFIYGTIDEEVVLMCRYRDELEKAGVILCHANSEAVFLVHDKARFNEWIAVEFPELFIRTYEKITSVSRNDLPVFIKPRKGRASIGCRKVCDFHELNNLKNYLETDEIVIQEYIEGEIIVVDVVRNKKYSMFKAIQRLELLRNSNGCGVAVEIVYDKNLEKICYEIAEKLDLNGVVNIEFFKLGNSFKIIEINPRFSAGTMYTCMAGYDIVKNSFNIARELPCLDENVTIGGHFAKRYEVIKL